MQTAIQIIIFYSVPIFELYVLFRAIAFLYLSIKRSKVLHALIGIIFIISTILVFLACFFTFIIYGNGHVETTEFDDTKMLIIISLPIYIAGVIILSFIRFFKLSGGNVVL
jgi:hypothetical protein